MHAAIIAAVHETVIRLSVPLRVLFPKGRDAVLGKCGVSDRGLSSWWRNLDISVLAAPYFSCVRFDNNVQLS